MSNHFVWVSCRAAGVAALILVSLSVGFGVTLSGRLARGRGADLRVAHEALSLAALAMIGLHGLSLLLDSYFHPSVPDLLVPFVRDYREPYMAVGIIGGWATTLFGLAYYVRERLGPARWRMLHRLTVASWALNVVHTIGEGTDGSAPWLLAIVALTVAPVLLLLAVRVTGRHRDWAGSLLAGREPR